MGLARPQVSAAAALALLAALAACTAADEGGPAVEAPQVLDGYLVYGEPLILPPDAVAEVRLLRHGGPVAGAEVVAAVDTPGPFVPPIPFRLLYDPLYLRNSGGGTLVLTAVIELYGRVLFRADPPLPVVLPLAAADQPVVVPLTGQWGVVEISAPPPIPSPAPHRAPPVQDG